MILGPQGPGKVGQRGGFFFAGVAQLVEHYLAKVDVASSNLVSRSIPPQSQHWGLFCGSDLCTGHLGFKPRLARETACSAV